MLPSQSRDTFVAFVESRGCDLSKCATGDIATLFSEFYREIRPVVSRRLTLRLLDAYLRLRSILTRNRESDPLSLSPDMLLFQWGTYGDEGNESFTIDFTRQFADRVKYEGEIEDVLSQLIVTCRFTPTETTKAIGSGHFWCATRRGIESFRQRMESSAAFKAFHSANPESLEIHWSEV